MLEPGYITGFADGEGTFNVIRYPEGRIRPQFLVFNTNKEILDKIKETLQIEAPIFEVKRVKDMMKSRKKCYRLQVRSQKDIEKVILFFDKHPPIVKSKEYSFFKETYQKWIN